MKGPKRNLILALCFCAGFVPYAFAGFETPTADKAFDQAAEELDKAKDEAQKLKDAWDKSRLETTLYDMRAKRAYQKWAKAAKGLKEKAKAEKEKAELEFQLSVEKRKLAYNEWQAAQLRMLAKESQLKALDQDKETEAIKAKIRQMEGQLASSASRAPAPGL